MKKVEEVTSEMVKEALEPKPNHDKTLIYCGPEVASVGLRQFSVFKNGLPANVLELECKAIHALFKPVEDLAKVKSQIAIKGSKENQLFNNVLKFIREG